MSDLSNTHTDEVPALTLSTSVAPDTELKSSTALTETPHTEERYNINQLETVIRY